MAGTLLNMLTVAIGSALGLLIGDRLPERIRQSVVAGLGLVTLLVGIQNANKTVNILIPLFSIAGGVIFGEMLQLDLKLEMLGGWLQRRFGAVERSADDADTAPAGDARQRFVTGFVTASLIFCVGPLTLLGSIQDGMGLAIGFQQLAIKSMLDGFASLAFAASFGVGVAFSVITILVVQGGLALAGSVLGNFMSEAMIAEMTATGGLVLIGLALALIDVKRLRMANFLPALLIAPLLVALLQALNIPLAPQF